LRERNNEAYQKSKAHGPQGEDLILTLQTQSALGIASRIEMWQWFYNGSREKVCAKAKQDHGDKT
jgi:hypothetical protein